MPYQYIIDNRFSFIPDKNRIEDLTNGSFILLITPASRCLATLLKNHRLVTHQELYSSGWAESGKDPAPGSLYQNISLIRKAFKELTNSDIDYITTVPRKGFIFKSDAVIHHYESAQDFPLPSNSENEMTHIATTQLSRMKRIRLHLLGKEKALIYINSTLIISSILLLIAIISRLTLTPKEDIFTETFIPYQEVNGCKYYIEKKTTAALLDKDNPLIKKLWNTAREENGISCITYPWRYVILLEHENRSRTFACTRQGDNDPGQVCITIFKRID